MIRIAPGLIACALVASLAFAAAPAEARSRVPYAGAFRQEIETKFFDGGGESLGTVSREKLAAYREVVEKKRRFLAQHVFNYETLVDGEDADDAREDVEDRDTMIALDHVLERLDEMSRSDDPARAYDLAAEVLMVEYATRSYTDAIKAITIPTHIKNMVFEWRVADASDPGRANEEATNLWDPETGEYYTADELAAIVRDGGDLSLLDPPPHTPFWAENGDIASLDVVENYLQGGDPIHEGIVSRFPPLHGAVFELDEPHMTQSKPKLDVYHLDAECAARPRKQQKKCRTKMKLKFGMETHADPVANALLSTLGYNVDVSMHLKDVKVYLGDYTRDHLERDWIGYFDRQRAHTYLPLHRMVKPGDEGWGRDERGEYVVFQEAVAELKEPELERIGYFPFAWGLAAEFREARGLLVFNAWIANADMKDEENNKLILRENAGGDLQMYLVQQDLGHSFGLVLPERPGAFPWDLVETHGMARAFGALNGSIELNYIDLQNNALERNATYADARWMVRRIARLTRRQIEDAVALGHWPGGTGPLYVEKLLNRRNQLVQAFGLEGEFGLLPVDRHLTTADGSVVDGELRRNRWDGSPINFDEHWKDIFRPVGTFFADGSLRGLHAAIAAVDLINPGDVRIEGNLRFLPRIVLRLQREVVLNPDPKGAFDQYIVLDSMDVGLRVGIGFIGSVEGTVLQRYALAFPVATRSEGLRAGIGIVDLLLPYHVWKGRLPERYVLFRETAFKRGFRVSSDHSSFLSPFGVDADQNWVIGQRSVIDRRGENPVVWVDRPSYLEREARLFLELEFLQVPFLGGSTSSGGLAGHAWTLDADKLDLAGDDGVAIFDRMVRDADFREAEKIVLGEPRQATVEFREREAWWNLFFASARSRVREEAVVVSDDAGRVVREEHQAERRRKAQWQFLDNGETQEFRVRGSMGANGSAPAISTEFDVDDLNTHSDELQSYYRLLERLGAGQRYLADGFEAVDWEVSGEPGGRWKRMLAEGSVQLHEEALDRLLHVDPTAFWMRLAENLELSPRELAHHWRVSRPSEAKAALAARQTSAGRRAQNAVRHSRAVLAALARAGRASDPAERMRELVAALYSSAFRDGDTFDPVILATLLEEAGIEELAARDQVVVRSRIFTAFDDQSNLPERRDVVGRLGGDRPFDALDYRLFPFGAIELYGMLDWLDEVE